jgi:glycosyltransferase involved in cell wall biosynthesis
MRILAFAYACEPERGSEPGAGWAWARMLARLGETWVITRREYQPSIERALRSVPERDNLTFVFVELPENMRSWQQGLRGLRVYYLLWQIAALKEARRLRGSMPFDLVWHLTWANAWYGTFASIAGRPFVYGPVGGCVGTVWRMLPQLGWNGATYEVARALVHAASRYANPLARLSWWKADLILAQNVETRDWLPRRHRGKTKLFTNAVIREELIGPAPAPAPIGPPTAVYAGRLEPFKGVFLCLRALTLLPGWKLVICGAGNDEPRMRRLARRLGVDGQVEWLGWLPQGELLQRMREADVFLFPSLHEEAGVAVAEARAAGLPVVCLARGGPPLLVGPEGICVDDTGGMRAVSARLADAAQTGLKLRREAKAHTDGARALSLDRRTEVLRDLLEETLGIPPRPSRTFPSDEV